MSASRPPKKKKLSSAPGQKRAPSEISTEIPALKSEIDDLKNQLQNKRSKISDFKVRLNDRESTITDLQLQLKNKDSEISNLRVQSKEDLKTLTKKFDEHFNKYRQTALRWRNNAMSKLAKLEQIEDNWSSVRLIMETPLRFGIILVN